MAINLSLWKYLRNKKAALFKDRVNEHFYVNCRIEFLGIVNIDKYLLVAKIVIFLADLIHIITIQAWFRSHRSHQCPVAPNSSAQGHLKCRPLMYKSTLLQKKICDIENNPKIYASYKYLDNDLVAFTAVLLLFPCPKS